MSPFIRSDFSKLFKGQSSNNRMASGLSGDNDPTLLAAKLILGFTRKKDRSISIQESVPLSVGSSPLEIDRVLMYALIPEGGMVDGHPRVYVECGSQHGILQLVDILQCQRASTLGFDTVNRYLTNRSGTTPQSHGCYNREIQSRKINTIYLHPEDIHIVGFSGNLDDLQRAAPWVNCHHPFYTPELSRHRAPR